MDIVDIINFGSESLVKEFMDECDSRNGVFDREFYDQCVSDTISLVLGEPLLQENEVYTGKGKEWYSLNQDRWLILVGNPSVAANEYAIVRDVLYQELRQRICKIAKNNKIAKTALRELDGMADGMYCFGGGKAIMLNAYKYVCGVLTQRANGVWAYTDSKIVNVYRTLNLSAPIAWNECTDTKTPKSDDNVVDLKKDFLKLLIKFQFQYQINNIMKPIEIEQKTAAIAALAYVGNREMLSKYIDMLIAFHPDYKETRNESYKSVLSPSETTQLNRALYEKALKAFLTSDRTWESWQRFLADCTAFCASIYDINNKFPETRKFIDFYVLPEFLSDKKEDILIREQNNCFSIKAVEAASVCVKNKYPDDFFAAIDYKKRHSNIITDFYMDWNTKRIHDAMKCTEKREI